MRYNPSEAKDSGNGYPPGTYNFVVVAAEDAVSQAGGNEMIKLTLNAQIEGDEVQIFDHLVNTPKGLWKPKMFCAEVGLNFEAGELVAQQCIGKGGMVELNYDPKDKAKVNAGTLQRAYLKVTRYGIHEEKPAGTVPPATNPGKTGTFANAELEDDTIPF